MFHSMRVNGLVLAVVVILAVGLSLAPAATPAVRASVADTCSVSSGCFTWQLLGVTPIGSTVQVRFQVTINCDQALTYASFGLPVGKSALSPANGSTYTSPNGYTYQVQNPTGGTIQFNYVSGSPALKSGRSDIFIYTLAASDWNPATAIALQAKAGTGSPISASLTPQVCLGSGTASIGDRVWHDDNLDGALNGAETGINGVILNLYNVSCAYAAAATPVASATTAGGGLYSFPSLIAGNYCVKLASSNFTTGGALADMAYTSFPEIAPEDRDVALTAGQAVTIVDFGYADVRLALAKTVTTGACPGATSLTIYDPSTVNYCFTVTNTGHTYLDNVTLRDPNPLLNIVAVYTGLLAPGDVWQYFASATVVTTTVNTADVSGTPSDYKGRDLHGASAYAEASATVTYIPRATLGDRVWEDTNANGIQDAGELGLVGVTVKLRDSGGNVISTTTTSSAGLYSFRPIPGSYSVEFVAPTGYFFSPKNAGGSSVDSDADPNTGRTSAITLVSNRTDLTWDAGLYRKATLGDKVWLDANLDGIQNSAENGVAGITVTLYTSAGALVNTTTTASDGSYSFSNLTPGSYYVIFTATGYTFSPQDQGSNDVVDSDASSSGQTANVTLVSNQSNLTVDAGIYKQISPILECVVNNGNGTYTAHFGYNNPNPASMTALVGSNNQFSPNPQDRGQPTLFAAGRSASWPAAPFSVPFDGSNLVWTLTGKTATASNSSTQCRERVFLEKVWLDPFGAVTTPPADLAPSYAITAISIDGAATCSYSGGTLQCVYPGGNGLTVPVNGTYTVTESVMPAGWNAINGAGTFTAQYSGGYCVSPYNGQANYCLHTVQNQKYTGSIGDYVWNDADGDKAQDGDELPLAGATVELYRGGVKIATATTGADGLYHFYWLPAGVYTVSVASVPAGYYLTTANNPLTVNLATAQTYTEADFGYAGKGSIPGVVFYDWNGDGQQGGPNEIGIANVQVCLYRDAGTIGVYEPGIDTQVECKTTPDGGGYVFSGLMPGNYLVVETQPSGLENSPVMPDVLAVPLKVVGAGGLANDQDFGELYYIKIGDQVYVDINVNSTQDAGEPGMNGVPLTLVGKDVTGAIVQRTTSSANGLYLFSYLLPGTYTVTVPSPFAGFSLVSLGTQTSAMVGMNGDRQDLNLDFRYIYPTAVTLARFEVAAENGRVELRWATHDASGLPFNVWRADNAKGIDAVRLTATPLDGQPDGSYEFIDKTVRSGQTYWYWLENTADGQRFGPQSVTVNTAPAMQVRAYLPMVSGQVYQGTGKK
ncbi:MAG: carboxypeptidase regulatory-like domain-containing protein [Chloroflexi bacterium]|nr:carboxypeptidase regulatory-like domain-containing protein [Chloroflexota bacterium]